MKFIPSQNVASSKITVTTTATALFSLINTAGSVTNSQDYALNQATNGVGIANGILITPEDGDIRLGYGFTPTSTQGTLLSSGTKYLIPNLELKDIKLIRVSGDVATSIDLLQTYPNDNYAACAEAVTLEASSITIGAVTADITKFGGTATTLGQKTKAASMPVTLASDDPAVVDLAAIEVLQTTIAGDTTSIDGKITACDTGAVVVSSGAITETNSAAIKTAVETIDNAISGTEMQVDVVASLPAGTNAIGKLASNSGVDIGDVDVTSTSIDGSINGSGAPTVDSYTTIDINAVTGANQVLVAAPGADKQIWVYGYDFTVDTAETTVVFQDEDDDGSGMPSYTEGFPVNSGVAKNPTGNFAMPQFKVATNKALEVDVTTGTIGGSMQYGIISV